MSTETFCSTSLHQKKWTKKICNVYLYINSRTNPYGFRTCCFLDVFSSLSQHFSHRDAVRNYLKWVFTSCTKNHYEVHLGCAANFLIKVNFLPCVFLLQKVVSWFLSSTCIHMKHNCSATSQNSESRNTHAFASGPGSSVQQGEPQENTFLAPPGTFMCFAFPLEWAESAHIIPYYNSAPGSSSLTCTLLSSLLASVWTHHQNYFTSAPCFRSLTHSFSCTVPSFY